MKRIIYIILCTVLAISCSKDTSPENMSESSIKQKLIGKTWMAVKEIDYGIDGKVLDTSSSSDENWEQEEWTFSEDGHVRWYTADDEQEVFMNYFIQGDKLIFGISPLTIKKLTNSELVVETQHEIDVEDWEASYSELYFKKK